MAESVEICCYPGNTMSKVWEYFGFYQVKEGPKTKENMDTTKLICRLCRKQYANIVACVLLILSQSHLNYCNVIFTGSTLCLKHSVGCFKEKILDDETMTCQFMLCCLLGISLLGDTAEFIHPITALKHTSSSYSGKERK